MADSSAYNKVTEVNPQLAAALYQYVQYISCHDEQNVLSNAKPANEIDVGLGCIYNISAYATTAERFSGADKQNCLYWKSESYGFFFKF